LIDFAPLMLYLLTGSAGIMYLYVKTIERAHTPARMWEKIKLSNNYTKALEQVRQGMTFSDRSIDLIA